MFEKSSVLACIMIETDSKSCAQRTLQVGWEDTTIMTQPTIGLPRNAMHYLVLNR